MMFEISSEARKIEMDRDKLFYGDRPSADVGAAGCVRFRSRILFYPHNE